MRFIGVNHQGFQLGHYDAIYQGLGCDLYRISAAYMGIDETVLRDKVRSEVTAS